MAVISIKKYLRRHARSMGVGVLFVFISTAAGLATPFAMRYAIDDVQSGGVRMDRLAGWVALYVLGTAVASLLSLFMRRRLLALSHLIEAELRADIFRHLTRMDQLFYSSERTGDIMTRMTSDLGAVRECAGQGLLQTARILIGFTMAFGVMLALNTRMTLVVLFTLPCTSIIFFILLRLIRARYERVQERFSELTNFVQESFAGKDTRYDPGTCRPDPVGFV